MTYDAWVRLPSPRIGSIVTWHTRSDTNDGALVTGIIALALAADHSDLKIIAVEPVPENVEGLRRNVEYNGFGDRVTVIEAAGDAPGVKTTKMLWNYRSAENVDQAYIDDSRYIANIFGPKGSDGDLHRVKAVSLDQLMEGLDELALLKIDCEGCEWKFLRSKRVADVRIILGEFHNGGAMASLEALIGATHEVTRLGGVDDIGVFRAVRR